MQLISIGNIFTSFFLAFAVASIALFTKIPNKGPKKLIIE